MNDPSLVADMIRGGVSPEIIQRVVDEILASSKAAVVVLKDSQAETRRASDRARKASKRSFVCGIPQNSAGSSPSFSPALSSPNPPSLPPSHTPPPARESVREREAMVEKIASAYPRLDNPMPIRTFIADCLDRGQDGEGMLSKVQECASSIRLATSGSGNRYVPTAKKFFEDEQWRSPEAFKRFEEPRNGTKPSVDAKAPNGGIW